jgi:hypothetical protein
MSIEINDLTNYYKLVNGSGGSLNLSYQQGGYDNMTPIMTFGNDGSLTANSLRQTVDPTDSNTPVLAQVNANGKLIRGYGITNTIANNFGSIESQLNILSAANTTNTGKIGTITDGLLSLSSDVSTLLGLNIPSQLTTLSGLASTNQSALNVLQGQNLNARVGSLESNTSVLTNAVSTLGGQNLNSRLTTAEGYVSTLNTNVSTLLGLNLGSRISSIENSNLDARVSQIQAVLGALSTSDANFIGQYNEIQAALHTLQLQVAELTNPNYIPAVTVKNDTIFYVVVAQGVILAVVLFYLFFRKK